MKEITITSTFKVYASLNELSVAHKELCLSAQNILKNAYAPYSNFFVGAAVLLEDGTIVTGTNQENAAYPSGLCAERVAIFYASSIHPNKKVVAVAVATKSNRPNSNTTPTPPCGACRQALSEYEVKYHSHIKILMLGENGEVYESQSVANLLPLMFSSESF